MRDMWWGENVLGNPETFSARMHIGHKEERRYGRGQCHDHVGIIRCVCTSNERSMGVPGSWSSLLRDRYNATVLSRPARNARRPSWKKFFNGVASSCSYERSREGIGKREIGGPVLGMVKRERLHVSRTYEQLTASRGIKLRAID